MKTTYKHYLIASVLSVLFLTTISGSQSSSNLSLDRESADHNRAFQGACEKYDDSLDEVNNALHKICKDGGSAEQVKDLILKGANVRAAREYSAKCMNHEVTGILWRYEQLLVGEEDAGGSIVERRQRLISAAETNKALRNVCKEGGTLEQIQELINKGANVNAGDEYGFTPLMEAASYGHMRTCEALIAKGANIHAVAYNGFTALLYAAVNNFEATVDLLIKHGADIHAPDKHGWSPLVKAIQNNSPDGCKLLTKKGADIHSANQNGFTPLMHAAGGGNSTLCTMLLRHMLLERLVEGEAGGSITERRRRLMSAFCLLNRMRVPRDVARLIIFGEQFRRDRIAVMFNAYCCSLRIYEDIPFSQEELLALVSTQDITALQAAIADTSRLGLSDYLRTLFNPENFNANFEELFLRYHRPLISLLV